MTHYDSLIVQIHGRLLSGIIKTGETVKVGPDTKGLFHQAKVEYLKVSLVSSLVSSLVTSLVTSIVSNHEIFLREMI